MSAIRRILGIDIGGTGLKAAVIDAKGRLISDRVRIPTAHHSTPHEMVKALVKLVQPLPRFDDIAVGFPGVVQDGRIVTAPNLGTKAWAGFHLANALSRALKAPVRIINDAEMQGLAVIHGKGLEFVITLGTGFGTALFRDGELMPHMELGQHPFHDGKTYDKYLGDKELKNIGHHKWQMRVFKAIGTLHTLLNYDRLYIGGGNAKRLRGKLPPHATRVSNKAGTEGGAALWRLKKFR